MRFPYVALAIKTNANEMYMQTQMILPILHFFFIRIRYLRVHSQMLCTFFPLKHVWLVGIKSLLSVPYADCLSVIRALVNLTICCYLGLGIYHD